MAEWPDELFEEVGKALPPADQMATGLQKLESMWWAEKRRRDAAVEQAPCDRPHMTEAAERVIQAAYKMDERHRDCVEHCSAACAVIGSLRRLERADHE